MKVLELSEMAKKSLDRDRKLFGYGEDYYKLFDEIEATYKEMKELDIEFDVLNNGHYLVNSRTFADIYPELTKEQEMRVCEGTASGALKYKKIDGREGWIVYDDKYSDLCGVWANMIIKMKEGDEK